MFRTIFIIFSISLLSISPVGNNNIFSSELPEIPNFQSSRKWYGTERQVTFGESLDIEPQWSPDGNKLSFASYRNESWDVWIIDFVQKDTIQVTKNLKYVQSTTWSPDGEYIALAASRDYHFGFTGHIYKKSLAKGGSLRRVTSGPVDGSPNWSEDGKYIIFTSNRTHNWEIWKVKVKNGKEEQLTETRVANLAPKWSPDGKKIAFYSTRSGSGDIYTMDEDGKALKRITQSDAFDHYPTWSPDGKYIAFQSDRSGNLDIWVIPSTGGKAIQLTDNPADDRRPAWSPDGTKIAFTSDRSGNDDIWILE